MAPASTPHSSAREPTVRCHEEAARAIEEYRGQGHGVEDPPGAECGRPGSSGGAQAASAADDSTRAAPRAAGGVITPERGRAARVTPYDLNSHNTHTFTHTQGSNTRRTQRRPHTAQNHIAADHRPDQSTGSQRTTPHAEQQARRGSIQAHPRHLSSLKSENRADSTPQRKSRTLVRDRS